MPGSISFNTIPAALRLPGVYIEFDNSLAGNAAIAFKVLVVGQRLAIGTVQEGVPTRVNSDAQAEEYFGRGSMLAEMLKKAKAVDPFMDTWAIALDDDVAGAAATGTITITGAATGSGALTLYIAGTKVPVAVTTGDDATAVATAVAAAITADTTLPVTAISALGVVTVTARHKGETGNDIDLRMNYYGEKTPAGIAVAFVAMAAGATNPDMATVVAGMGPEWYNWIVSPFTDATNMLALEAELDARWGPMQQIGGRAFTAFRGSHAAAITHGDGRNNPHVTCMGTNTAPQPPYIWAAVNAMVAAGKLANDPARPLQTLKLPGIMAPAIELRWTDAERNLLLFDGISTYTVGSDGAIYIERQITMYQENGAGLPDDSYLDINTPETLERIRFEIRALFGLKYPRHKLAEDDARIGAGQPVMQPKLAKAELLALYRTQEEKGWVQDYEGYKAALIILINAGNPTRLDIQDSPKLVGQLRTIAAQTQFRR